MPVFRKQFLYFFPLPQGHISFGYIFLVDLFTGPFEALSSLLVPVTFATCSLSLFAQLEYVKQPYGVFCNGIGHLIKHFKAHHLILNNRVLCPYACNPIPCFLIAPYHQYGPSTYVNHFKKDNTLYLSDLLRLCKKSFFSSYNFTAFSFKLWRSSLLFLIASSGLIGSIGIVVNITLLISS